MTGLFANGLYGIIYDCDGVMIDSAEANRHLYNLVLSELNLPPVTREQEKFAFQATFFDAIRFLVPASMHGLLESAISRAVNYDRDILPKIKLMPGYRDFVHKAHARHLEQAIDTNRTAEGIQKIIDRFDLPHYFSPVISCTSVKKPKPSPEGVEKIRSAWKCEAAQILFVGDSPDDRAAARGAGAVFAAFGESDLAGDIKIHSWAELEKILRN